jgi:hypothetical protein
MIAKSEKVTAEEASEKAWWDEQLSKTEAKKSELDDGLAKLTSKDRHGAMSAQL